MKIEFIQERIENDDVPRLLECLSGWEAVVFVVEDEPRHPERSEGPQVTQVEILRRLRSSE
jgi:hypothetical protein